MSINFDILKHLDTKTKYTVFGYVRKVQQLLLLDSNAEFYHNIPELINNICLAYYRLGSYFEKGPYCIEFSGVENNTITKHVLADNGWDNAVYSNYWINSNQNKVIKLTLKINKVAGGAAAGFGIINNKHHHNVSDTFYREHSYAYFNSGYVYIDGDQSMQDAIECGTNDIVTFTLDLTNRQIIIDKNNGADMEVVFKNIEKRKDIKYKFALTFFDCGNSVTVLSYSEHLTDR
eukprot:395206_1